MVFYDYLLSDEGYLMKDGGYLMEDDDYLTFWKDNLTEDFQYRAEERLNLMVAKRYLLRRVVKQEQDEQKIPPRNQGGIHF